MRDVHFDTRSPANRTHAPSAATRLRDECLSRVSKCTSLMTHPMEELRTKKSPLLGARMLNGGELGIPALPLATLVGFAALSPWQATGLPRPCGSNPWGIFRQKKSPLLGARILNGGELGIRTPDRITPILA